MKIIASYQDLDNIAKSIDLERRKPAFELFHRQKIKDFFAHNSIRINLLNDKRNAIIKAHVLHKEDKPVIKKDENGVPVYDFATEEDKVAYIKEYNELMQQDIEIEV